MNVNAELNRVLVRLYRSKLQYVGECWPWTSAAEAQEEREIGQLVQTQQQHVASLVELLTARSHAIEFGQYPDLSELHYVNLDYVLETLAADAEATIRDVEQTKVACEEDASAASLLSAILDAERAGLEKIKALAAARQKQPALSV
jgi:hypothetical protein